jgi:antitoxin MazE
MQAVVAKWGNSLGLRIPRSMVQALGLAERSEVEVSVDDGALIVRPVVKRKQYDLNRLVAAITDKNRHDEFSTGSGVGEEY